MRFRSPLLIISLQTSLSWTFFIITGLLDIRTFAENSINQTVEIESIMRNAAENKESIQNSSKLIVSKSEKISRMPHKLEYYSIQREASHETTNINGSQNRSFGSETLPLKNVDKINFSKKPALKNSGWLLNNKSRAQRKKETYEDTRKSSTSEAQQYDAEAYKDYYQQQQQQQQQRQQQQKHASQGVEYADGYNTITSNAYIDDYKDYRDYGNIAEEQDIQNWRNSYYPSAGGSASYGCSCHKQPLSSFVTNRQNCDNPASTFLQILGMLGDNMWQLIQIMATSAIPFVIPILALKLILIPIKIFKFLQLIKFFFKLFIILPFVIRFLYPVISNGMGIQNWFYSKPSHGTHPDHHYDHSESREENNATGSWHSDLDQYMQYYINLSDDTLLRSCPSKAACELGSFLSTSTKTKFPEKLSKYLVKRAEEAEELKKTNKKGDSLESEKESAIRAFIVALGEKWAMEQCAVYTCSVIL